MGDGIVPEERESLNCTVIFSNMKIILTRSTLIAFSAVILLVLYGPMEVDAITSTSFVTSTQTVTVTSTEKVTSSHIYSIVNF